ncbi:hypothetical protein AU252_22505 [Pseudarthrobacter sulfonivorans]|uniref:Uncharacterized protein n=1 Tax=Pseudarthrobacter sulfonivorans TaxID=121292 RepID=A0A0U2XIN0_9MICC|nr:hypothetical protein AU252_22505 [Pseudarthrobacter sulfonivorans]
MANELFGRAAKSADKETVRRYPRVARDAALVKSVVEVLFEAEELSEDIPLGMVWGNDRKSSGIQGEDPGGCRGTGPDHPATAGRVGRGMAGNGRRHGSCPHRADRLR